MCTFNGSAFLSEQLASIVTQTRPPHELVVCDDGSVDGTLDLLETFAETSPFPVRLHRNPSPLGVAANFSLAVSLCTGSVVALCDQDDVWAPTKLERQLDRLDADPAMGAVFTDATLVDSTLEPLGASLFETTGFSPRRQRRLRRGDGLAVLLSRPVVCGTTLAFRSSHRDLLLPIPSTGLHDVWLSVLLAATSEIAVIPEPLVLYRQHASNQVGAPARGAVRKLARRRAKGVFGDEVAHFVAMAERLAARADRHGPGHVDAQRLLAEKVDHLRFRASLPESRLVPVVGQLARGRYHRFSRGLTSAAFDVLFRHQPARRAASEATA